MKVTINGVVTEGTPEEIKEYFELLGAEFPVNTESEENPKFKEGDRVKALADGEDGDIKAGEVGTIERLSEYIKSNCDPYYIVVETEDTYDYFRPQDLELVTEEGVEEIAKIKVGDFARVTLKGHPNEGKVVKIIGDNYDERYPYDTELLDGEVGDCHKEEHLEKVEETPSKPATIKRKARVGERILITDASSSGSQYDNGDILTVRKVVGKYGTYDAIQAEGVSIGIFDYEYEVIGEECAEAKRKPGEFKKGDIVSDGTGNAMFTVLSDYEIESGYVSFPEMIRRNIDEVKLVAPVEARVDMKAEV